MIEYEFTDNNIKFINNTNNDLELKLVGVITGTNITSENFHRSIIKKGTWFIPNFNYLGICSVRIYINGVYNHTLSLPNKFNLYEKNKQKIIGIGLNKTGTTSLSDSLKKEGFKIFNEVYGHQFLLQDVHHGNIHSTISFLENPQFEVYQDTPFSLTNIYKEIYKYRPDDYYILTVRNSTEEWVESALCMYENLFLKEKNGNIKINYTNTYECENLKVVTTNHLYCLYENWGINGSGDIKNQFRDVYNRHLDDVTNFFSKKIDSNFITINVSKENELKRLSNFIGFETTENDFVWSNKSKK